MHHPTTLLCSSWLNVGLSPVVPTGTRPWVPSAICQLTRPRKAASSSEPFLKGVTKAVNDPRNFVLAAMDFLQTLKKRHDRNWISIHIGSGDQAKGLYPLALVLCFDVHSRRRPPPATLERPTAAILPR